MIMSSKSLLFGSPKTRSPFTFGKSRQYEHVLTGKGSPQVEKDLPNGITPYNASLPVQVVEALAFTDAGHVSCKLDPSGWAWLIKNKKLYVWKYTPSTMKTLSCSELYLSSTELYHKADLTCIVQIPVPSMYTPKQSGNVAVMNISPEGAIRYWPNISKPGLFIESSAGLNGKECYSLTPVKPYGCILITTSNDVILLRPTQSTITCKQFYLPVGMLSGISRRVSTFLLRSAAQPEISHLPKMSCCNTVITEDENTKTFYVWASGSLNKWELSYTTYLSEKLLFQADVIPLLKEGAANLLEIDQDTIAKIEPLDICSTGTGVALLAGVVIPQNTGIKLIVICGTLECGRNDVGNTMSSLACIKPELYFQSEDDIPELKLIIPSGLYRGFVYKSDVIASVPVAKGDDACVTVYPPGKDIIGAGFTGQLPIFLSRRNGFITLNISTQDLSLSTSLLNATQSSTAINDVEMVKVDPTKALNFGGYDGDDDLNVLAQGFCVYAEGNVFESQEMVSELTLGYAVDKIVVKMSRDIVDSIPASDPRWANSEDPPGGTLRGLSPSVIIMNQLQDKEKYHAMFITYLQDVDLWDKATKHCISGKEYSTKLLLLQNAEKIRASMILQEVYQSYPELMDRAFSNVVSNIEEDSFSSPELTNQDRVFQKVSKIERLFAAIFAIQADSLKSVDSVKEKIATIMAVNTIFTEPLKESLLIRKTWSKILENHTTEGTSFYMWTATGGKDGMRTILRDQGFLTVETYLPNADNTKTGSLLAQQAYDLADILLDGYQSELQYKRDMSLEEAFTSDRKRILIPLVREGYYEISLELAEKYKDFSTLIALCEQRNDREKMDQYKSTFADVGFLDHLYQWYIDKGDWQKLLNQEPSNSLDNFLLSHHKLRWLNDIGNREFHQASSTLFELAREEEDILSRKKTMLSISKLCLLASSQDADIVGSRAEEIENELTLIQMQETLPEEIISKAALDTKNMPPLSAEKLIELYVGEANTALDVFDFRRAVELVQYLDENIQLETRIKIWSIAVLQDHCWTDQVILDPVMIVSQTFFGQCVLSLLEARDALTVIPTIASLLASPILMEKGLSANTNFHYLLKAFYERYEL